MHIGMVLTSDFPPDTRVEKEALSLISAGHKVYVLCLRYSKSDPACENYRGIEVVRAYLSKYIHKKLFALILTVPFYRWFWRKKIQKFICEKQIEVLHIHDLPLCGEGIRIAKAKKIHIVADMHENYPELIKVQQFSNTLTGKLLISKKKWYKKEKEWLKQIKHIICVEKEMKERMKKISAKSCFYVVPNTPDIKDVMKHQIDDPSIQKKTYGDFNLLYFGKTDNARGIDTLIKALIPLKEKIPRIHAIIVGTGIALDDYMKLGQKHGLEKNISFEGWIPENYLKNYMENVDICVLPHIKSTQTDNSSPNKLFLYMAFQKAIISSNCNSIVRIIKENDCGLIFKSGNYLDLSEKILELYQNKSQRAQYALNAVNAINQKYNWAITAKSLIALYEKLKIEKP